MTGMMGRLLGQGLDPSPALTPQQVVQFQLDALRQNDNPTQDAGIARTFRFASPANKLVTGPLEHFTEIVRSPAYSPLLNCASAKVVRSEVGDDQAKVLAQITSGIGRQIYYLFLLSKQKEGEYRDCWMTDGVMPVETEEDQDTDAVTI